jgi:hypothetical protein
MKEIPAQKRSILTAVREAKARPPEPPKAASAAAKPIGPATEDVTAPCLHVIAVPLFPPKTFEGRKRKAAGRPCPACREARQKKEMEEARLRRIAKGPRKDRRLIGSGRWPSGTVLHAAFSNEGAPLWAVLVRIPGEEEVRQASGSSLENVQRGLYQAWAREHPVVPVEGVQP